MDQKTSHVVKEEVVTVIKPCEISFDFGLGRVTAGPYMPILSGGGLKDIIQVDAATKKQPGA